MGLCGGMEEVDFYRRLYKYNRKVLENLLGRMRRMSWKEVIKDRGTGLGSFRDTFVHMVRVHDAWVNFIVPGRVSELPKHRPPLSSYRSWASLRELFLATWKHIDKFLAQLRPKDLRKVVRAPWMPGRYTLADVLMQCTFEEAHHLGELIGASWQEDKAPPQMMWIPILYDQRVRVY